MLTLAAALLVSATPLFSAPASASLEWRIDLDTCDGDRARVRLSLVDDGDKQVDTLLLPDTTLGCPAVPVAPPRPASTALTSDAVVVKRAAAGASELTAGSFAVGGGRRGVVVVMQTGADKTNAGFDHALFVEEGGRINSVWRERHDGDGAYERRFELDNKRDGDAPGDHFVYAVARVRGAPFVQLRVGYDAKKKLAAVEVLPFHVVILGSFASEAEGAQKRDALAAKCARPDAFMGQSDGLPGLMPGLFVVAVAAATSAEAERDLASLRAKCAPDAYRKEIAVPLHESRASSSLSWRVEVDPCVAQRAPVRLSLIDAHNKRVDSQLLEGVDMRCPTSLLRAQKSRTADGAVLASDAGEYDRSTLDVGSFAIAKDRRGIAVVFASGYESIGYDHALYVEESAKIKRVWREAHAGFEMGNVEHEFEIERQADGSDRWLYAVQHLGTEQPLERRRIGYDVAKQKVSSTPLPYFLVVLGTYTTLADATAASPSCARLFLWAGPTSAIRGLKPGAFVAAQPAATRAEGEQQLVDAKKCVADAYLKEVHN